MLIYFYILVIYIVLAVTNGLSENNSCIIFCSDDILHYVQTSKVFKNRSFFDSKLKHPPSEIQLTFQNLLNSTNRNPSDEALEQFFNNNFDYDTKAYSLWSPEDWVEQPKYIEDIYDIHLRKWAKELNSIWKKLGRKVEEDVQQNDSLYSLIYVPKPYIVPGGLFHEIYYWDSYWIVEGLILSEMFVTAKYMVQNLLYLVKQFGFVPNGGRVYYLERSQVPLLIPMFDLYWEAKKDLEFLNESIYLLEKEFQFWIKNRSLSINKFGDSHRIFRYFVNTSHPRPESYDRDVTFAKHFNNSEKLRFYSEIKAAAESGWDFSTRWFLNGTGRTNNITDAHTSQIAPVDLNSIMGYNAKLLSKFYSILGNDKKSKEYNSYFVNISKTVARIFWHDEQGCWFDYDIKNDALLTDFYPANLVPLWAEMHNVERDSNYIASRVLSYLERINISSYPGGVPTSLNSSNQQWDLPNGWAPLQYFAILGLEKLGNVSKEASDLAFTLAEKWVYNCYITYNNASPHAMFEKYDVTKIGLPGGGGEYVVQEGFGWTNGVVIKFLNMYSHHIRTSHFFDPVPYVVFTVLAFIFLMTVIAHCCRLRQSRIARSLKQQVDYEYCSSEENFV